MAFWWTLVEGGKSCLIPLSDIRALSYQFISAACIHLVLITALYISTTVPMHHVSAQLMPCLTFTFNYVPISLVCMTLHAELSEQVFLPDAASEAIRSPASPKRMGHSLHLQLSFMIIPFNHLNILGAAPRTLVACTDTIHSRNHPV